MALHRSHNVYKGINAHLHSYFQHGGEWAEFHKDHITDLKRHLQRALPFEMGYRVISERSLQIAHYDEPAQPPTRTARVMPDVAIYRAQSVRTTGDQATAAPTLIVPTDDRSAEDAEVMGIGIYRVQDTGALTLLTRLELLSPANKPPGAHATTYRDKRRDTLRSGVRMVELDYLHERPTPINHIPDYRQGEQKATPYRIVVAFPSVDAAPGKTEVYGFRVDDPLPVVGVPLQAADRLAFDFGAVYQQTFAANNRYAGDVVDYAQEPGRFERYDDEDQRRIRAVMARATQDA